MITATVCGQNAFSLPYGLSAATPANLSLPVTVTNTPGDWMAAAVTWREGFPGAGINISIEDDAHNMWEPLGSPSGDSPGGGQALPGTPGPTGATTFTADSSPAYPSQVAAVQGFSATVGRTVACQKIYFAAPGASLINQYPYYNTGYVAGQNIYIDSCLTLKITPICCYKPALPYTSADSAHMTASMGVINAKFAAIGITPIWICWQEVQNAANGISAATWLGTGTPGVGAGNTGYPQYYADIKTAGIPGLVYYDAAGHAGPSGWQAYFPGPPNLPGLYCDGVGIDFYASVWNNGAVKLDAAAALADAFGLPFALFEIGQTVSVGGLPSRATLQAYFSYLTGFMVSGVPGGPAGRLASGKPNGPVLWYNGGPPGNWNTIAPQPNTWGYDTSYIPALWAALVDALAGSSAAGGVMRTAWWAAPAALAAGTVMIAPTGLTTAMAATILDLAGMAPWMSLAAILSGFTSSGATLSLGLPAPPSQAIMLAALGSSVAADTITLGGGAGWTPVAAVSATNGTDTTTDVALNAAWQVTTAAAAAAWTSSAAQNLSGVTAALLVTGTPPAQPNPDWPVVITEGAPGAGFQTAPSDLTWVPFSPQSLDFTISQGAPYLRGQLQAGQGAMILDNPDGTLIPPGSGAFTGIDSGTPVRQRLIWQGGAWQAQFHGNGSAASPQIDSGQLGGVVPGNTYTASAWLGCSVLYSPGLTAQISWWTSGGAFISATAAAPACAGPQPVLAIASGTAPAGAARWSLTITAAGTPPAAVIFSAAAAPPAPAGYLPVPAAATWTAASSATVTTLAPFTPDPRGAPVICPQAIPFSGYFQQWPQAWDPVMLRGEAQAVITDVWGYASRQLRPPLRAEILTDSPAVYWPMTGAASASFVASAAGAPVPLAITISKYGSGGAGAAFGAAAPFPLPGDGSSTMFAQTLSGAALTTSGNGYCLSGASSAYPPISGGITVDCFFQGTWPSAPPFNSHLWTLLDGRGPVLRLSLNTSGNLLLTSWSQTGVSSSVVLFSPQAWFNSSSLIYITATATQAGYQVFANGAASIAAGSFASPIRASFSLVNLMGSANRWVTGGQMAGYLAHFAIYPAVLPIARWGAHLYAGTTALAFTGGTPGAESCSSRVERLLGYAGMPGRRLILPETGPDVTYAASAADISGSTSATARGTTTTAGSTASTALANMAASTPPAVLTVTPTGAAMYLARQYAYNQPVKWVLGTRADLGEFPFTGVPPAGYDPARVVNDITITQEDTQVVTIPDIPPVPVAPNPGQYGDQTYNATGYLQYDATTKALDGSYGYSANPGLADLADWIANTLGLPHPRIPAVTIECASNPAAWVLYMRAATGDMVTLNWRPPTNPLLTFTITARATKIDRALSFSQGKVTGAVTLALDYAPEESALTADDPVRGQLTGQNVLSW